MSIRSLTALFSGAVLALTLTACDKKIDPTIVYTSAINNYYYNHPACIWQASRQFPIQLEPSDSKTANYTILVDQGLLVRTSAPPDAKHKSHDKQMNSYDLTDKGRIDWTDDETQPGFGNFCYGRRKVASIDSSTPAANNIGATTQVAYHYTFNGSPNWAKAAEVQKDYPQIQTDLAGPQSSTATLTETDAGWQVTSVPKPGAN